MYIWTTFQDPKEEWLCGISFVLFWIRQWMGNDINSIRRLWNDIHVVILYTYVKDVAMCNLYWHYCYETKRTMRERGRWFHPRHRLQVYTNVLENQSQLLHSSANQIMTSMDSTPSEITHLDTRDGDIRESSCIIGTLRKVELDL